MPLPQADPQEAQQAAERIRAAVPQAAVPHNASATAPVVTITGGVSTPQGGVPVTAQSLMQRAGAAAG